MNISTSCTTVSATMEIEEGDNIRIQLFLDTNFQASCSHLAEHLSCCARPVDDTFPQSSTQQGEIRLNTDTHAVAPIVLWACHNIFVRAELLLSAHSESVTPSRTNSEELVDKITENLFKYIREGFVPSLDMVTRPKVQNDNNTCTVPVGETFAVDISVDQQCLENVECDDNVS